MTTGVLAAVRAVPQTVPAGVAYADGTGPEDAPEAADEHPLARHATRHASPAGRTVPINRRTGRFVVTAGTFPVERPAPRRTSGCLGTHLNGSRGSAHPVPRIVRCHGLGASR